MNLEKTKQKLLQNCEQDSNSGCWNWLGYLANGYGRINVDRKNWLAHRLSYSLFVGEIPDGKDICHKCDNPACVNPDHLFVGTHSDNMHDMVTKNRSQKIRGEAHHGAKLNWRIVEEIRNSKDSLAVLARKYSISKGTVCRVRTKRIWNT